MRIARHLSAGLVALAWAVGWNVAAQPPASNDEVSRAEVTLVPVGDSGASGTVTFEQVEDGVRVRGRIEGLKPGAHGFHVHEYGDLSAMQDGKSAGEHFSPEESPHGSPSSEERHVGDLGNIEANAQGVATIDFVDDVITLSGEHSVVGRALVVHADRDAFTQPSGDAGDRVAFGVIGIAQPSSARQEARAPAEDGEQRPSTAPGEPADPDEVELPGRPRG